MKEKKIVIDMIIWNKILSISDFDTDNEIEIGLEDLGRDYLYVHLNQEQTQQLIDHLTARLNDYKSKQL